MRDAALPSYVDLPFGCPPEVSLRLPVPPSVNQLYGNRRGCRYKTKRYRDWLLQAGLYHVAQWRKTGELYGQGAYIVHIRIPQKLRGDADNRIKPILDFLVSRSVTDDDKHCQKVTCERDPNLTDFCEVNVWASKGG